MNIFEKWEVKEYISFQYTPKDDLMVYSLRLKDSFQNYDIDDKRDLLCVMFLKNKYNFPTWDKMHDWLLCMENILENYSKEDFLKLIDFCKSVLLDFYGESVGMKAYASFLDTNIIGNASLYNKFVLCDEDMTKFLHNEIKLVFPHFDNRKYYKLGHIIEELYWYHTNAEMSGKWDVEFDNMWQGDRYKYWNFYGSKGEVIVKKDII